MKNFYPSYRGWLALFIVFLLALFLPAVLPAREGHSGRLARQLTTWDWSIAIGSILAAFAACAFAASKRQAADIVCAMVGVLLTAFIAYGFAEAADAF